MAGILLVILPTVIYGGVSLLTFLVGRVPGYLDNPMRQNLFRAGHAHAGVMLLLSLLALRYVDEAELSNGWKRFVRSGIPSAAIFLPAGFFFSVLSPSATEPNRLIYLAFIGAVVLAASLVALGVGLLRTKKIGE
jgi:peptidoglycan/LPS O-acetylase OafA/YrhL